MGLHNGMTGAMEQGTLGTTHGVVTRMLAILCCLKEMQSNSRVASNRYSIIHRDHEPSLFLLMNRVCHEALAAEMLDKPAFVTGAGAMMRHLLPDNLLHFLKHREGAVLSIELRVPRGQSFTLATALQKRIKASTREQMQFLYMIELVCRSMTPQAHTLMQPGGKTDLSVSMFLTAKHGSSRSSVYLRTWVHASARESARADRKLPDIIAIRIIDIVELDEHEWAWQSESVTGFKDGRSPALKHATADLLLRTMDKDQVVGRRLLLDTQRQFTPMPKSSKVLRRQEAMQVPMLNNELQRLSAAVHPWLILVKIGDEDDDCNTCPSVADVIQSYSTHDSGPYNVACMIARYRGTKPKGNMHTRGRLVAIETVTAAIACAAWNTRLQLDDENPLYGAVDDTTHFTVYRGVDYFQPLGESSGLNVYDAQLPFSISNLTVSSTSIFKLTGKFFVKPFGCMLVLNVPVSYRRFIALGKGLSHNPREGEILFPEDAVFVIEGRAFTRNEQNKLVLMLIGKVECVNEGMVEDPCGAEGLLSCLEEEQVGQIQGGSPLAARASHASMSMYRMLSRPRPSLHSSRLISMQASAVESSAAQAGRGPTLRLIDLTVFGDEGPEQDAALSEVFQGILGLEGPVASLLQIAGSAGHRGPLKADLARRAASLGVRGFSRMRKQELVKSIKRMLSLQPVKGKRVLE